MSGFKVSLFNIHGRQSMAVNMSPWMSRFFYRSAIFNGYADYLSILTIFVSFGLISGSHRDRLMAFRCLKQIFTDLLWKRRPPWKPPWNQIIRTLQFGLSTNVKKDMEIMDLSWVISSTKTLPSPSVRVGDDCNACDVTGDDGMKLWLDLIHHRRLLLYSTVMDSYFPVWKKFTISSEVGVLFLPTTTLNDVTGRRNIVSAKALIKHMWRGCWRYLWVMAKVIYLTITSAHKFRKRTTLYGEVGALFFLALILVDDVVRMRTRRSNLQYVWMYGTIITNYISFFMRVPQSRVLRCNGWIADFVFRKRKRWIIDKKQMFPKLESHTRLKDKTKATKHMIRIAVPKLFCFFVTKTFDCIYVLLFNITIFGSY